MLRIIAKIAFVAVLGCVALSVLQAVEVQRFQRQPNWNALHMDGKLGDPFWQKIKAPLSAFHICQEKDLRTDDTRVKITFDDKWLYFGLECVNMEPGYDRNAVSAHDGAVPGDDSVEIFISSDKERASYCHFMLNCDNVKAEQKVVGSGAAAQKDRTWNPVWLSAAAKNEHGWTAEIAIPLELLAENGKVGTLSFNIARTKLIPEFDSQGVRLGEHRQTSVLFPVKDSFHEPGVFAELKGLEAVEVKEACHLKLDGSAVESFYVRDGKTFYDVFVKYSCDGKGGGCAEITVVDKPEQSEQVKVTMSGKTIGPGWQETVKLSVPVAVMGARTATVILKDSFTKGVVEQFVLSNLDKLMPLDAYFSRNYYTSENYAELACSVALPPESLKGSQVILKDGQSNELFRTDAIMADNLFRVDLAKVPLGETSAVLELVNKEGTTLFHKALTLVKRASKPGYEWKIDQLNGVLLNNGKPFFPFGVGDDRYTVEKLQATKNIGLNTFQGGPNFPDEILAEADRLNLHIVYLIEHYYPGKKIPNLSKYLAGDELKQADILYSANALQSTLNYGHKAFKKLTRAQRNEIFNSLYLAELPQYMAGIDAVKTNMNLLGYYTFDEPGFSGLDLFVQGRDLYKKTNEADGYRPTLLLYSTYIPPGPEATDWCDILCTDPYWIPDGTLKERSTINFVSKIVCRTKERADAARKMTWIVPMGSYWSATHRRLLTPAEQLCQSYLCIIHGAKAMDYYKMPEHKLLQDAIKTFGEQLAVLAPALLAPAVKQKTTYSPIEFIPEKDSFPAVQVALFQYPSGEAVLLAANTAERQHKVSYSLSCLPAKGEIKRLFKPETFKVTGGSFSDSLEPFGVRAYALAQNTKLSGPVKILVKSEPDESAPPPAARLPTVDYWGRTGKKNVAPNPSFEEVTVPDLPDYIQPGGKTTIGFENSNMKVVTTDPYEGKVCLQLTNPEEPDAPLKYVGFGVYCAPQNPKTETYTWSIYMKGDRDGQQVLFGNHDMKEWDGKKWRETWKMVELTREWKRYSVTGPVPANVYRKCGLEFQLRGYGTIWVDAMQMEKGDTPTVFEP